jgi:predicted GNAT family acetyltransferase
MKATRLERADAFLVRAGPFLAAHEAEHNLVLGLLGRLTVEPRPYGLDPTFVIAEDAGSVVGCLLRTPPHGVVLSRFDSPAAVDAVAAEVIDMHPELPGALGPAEVSARFAEAWSRATGSEASLTIRQRIRAAAAVQGLPRAPGRMRRAGPADRETIVAWLRAFVDEALAGTRHVEDAEASYERRVVDPDGEWLLWDDGGAVSLAAYGNPTPSGVRVGPVYTPPEQRGRGYATSLVAELTAERLAAGRGNCFLFTDLANPTSDAIYARIGYEPVADWDQWAFRPLQH